MHLSVRELKNVACLDIVRNAFDIGANGLKLSHDLFVAAVYMKNAVHKRFAIGTQSGKNKRSGRPKV